jgi:hypothetical protein
LSISVVAALLNRGSVFCANFEFGVPEPMWDALARTIVGADDRREPVCPLCTKRTWGDFRLESVMRSKVDSPDHSELMGSRSGSSSALQSRCLTGLRNS